MVKKLIAISVVFLLVVMLAGYYKLGGFNPVHTELVQVNNYYLLGRYFEGGYRSDTTGQYFKEMTSLVQQGTVKGLPTIIYDQEPGGSRGTSRSFIGILLENNSATAANLVKREIVASRAIRVSKDAHISVMPNPDKISKKIREFGQQQNVKPIGPSIEIYHPNNRLVIEQPVLANE